MSEKYLIVAQQEQVPPYEPEAMAQGLLGQLGQFLAPLVLPLDRVMDKRLLRTLVQTVQVILTFRDRMNGLLLSELGGYLLHPAHAPAGTKRLSRLLHCPDWQAQHVDAFLWQQASEQVEAYQEKGEESLAIWDSSEWEKPETEDNEDLCAVLSSKGQRLTHIKPGYFTPPGRPIFVPGLHWIGVVLVGLSAQAGSPKLALMHYWSSRGVHASFKVDEEGKVLQQQGQWGRKVIHVFDRGYASAFWIGLLLSFRLRFELRFKGKNHLLDAAGNRRNCWRIPFGKRGWEERIVWDSRRARKVHASVLALPVCHLRHPETTLWLVVCRSKGREPWYLLTNETISSPEDAWRIVSCYSRRWQIEQTWRYDKSELAFQSPRVWSWQVRLKLLALATLAYAFLLHLLLPRYGPLRLWLLRHYCHRTDQRLRRIKVPLYRLRIAISRLWQQHPPNWWALAQSSSASTRPAKGSVVVVEEQPTEGLVSSAARCLYCCPHQLSNPCTPPEGTFRACSPFGAWEAWDWSKKTCELDYIVVGSTYRGLEKAQKAKGEGLPARGSLFFALQRPFWPSETFCSLSLFTFWDDSCLSCSRIDGVDGPPHPCGGCFEYPFDNSRLKCAPSSCTDT